MNKPKNPAAVTLGSLGGKAGRGASKRRTSEHYRQAALKRWRAKRDNQTPTGPR